MRLEAWQLTNYIKDICMNMKRLWVVMAICVGVVMHVLAQGETQGGGKYEVAMIKWDGPDKLAIVYPDRAEALRVFRMAKLPADVTEEEFCLTWGANKLAKEGWEPVNLNSRRVLFRRAIKN